MIKELMQLFKQTEGYENVSTPQDVYETFLLNYKNLLIGELSLKHGEWEFVYSEAFKDQDNIKPLIAFPIVNKLYKSSDLWPFFFTRIPSLHQPEIQEAIKSHNLNEHNEVELLKYFGKKTITNPFELVSQ